MVFLQGLVERLNSPVVIDGVLDGKQISSADKVSTTDDLCCNFISGDMLLTLGGGGGEETIIQKRVYAGHVRMWFPSKKVGEKGGISLCATCDGTP